MRADADDKRREVDAARATADRLPAELKERRAELERVSSLDERLRAEIESLEQRRAEMEVRGADWRGRASMSARHQTFFGSPWHRHL